MARNGRCLGVSRRWAKIDNISLDEFAKALKVFWREYETVLMHSNADLL